MGGGCVGAKMTDKTFKEKIYGPYLDAWKIIKILQEAYQKPQLFLEYAKAVDEYEKRYLGNDFAQTIRNRLLLCTDDVIAKMERENAV